MQASGMSSSKFQGSITNAAEEGGEQRYQDTTQHSVVSTASQNYSFSKGVISRKPNENGGGDDGFMQVSDHNPKYLNPYLSQRKMMLLENAKNKENFYITISWSPQIYFTIRGAENFHIYLWITKDLCWAQDAVELGMIFGSLAVLWLVILGYHAFKERYYEEVYMLLALSLWLIGNYVWMEGELINNDDQIAAPAAGHIFEVSGALIILYHILLRPMGWISYNAAKAKVYEEAGLKCRFAYFQTWRQYEHAHTLFWLGKDWSWNQTNPYTWVFFLIPTVLIAVDFIVTTWKSRKMTIDCMHYVAQLLWVMGNFTWALVEIFDLGSNDDKNVYFIFNISPLSAEQGRWYAAWVLFFAYFPIFGLYMIWLPLTCSGRLSAAAIPENERFLEESDTNRDSGFGWDTWKGSISRKGNNNNDDLNDDLVRKSESELTDASFFRNDSTTSKAPPVPASINSSNVINRL